MELSSLRENVAGKLPTTAGKLPALPGAALANIADRWASAAGVAML